MPRGKVAGFPRPLAEGELVLRSAFAVNDDYGERLEGGEFRANEEDKIEQIAVDVMGGRKARNLAVELSPAGNVLGINIATSSTTILSEESRGNTISTVDMVRLMVESRDRISGITGYRTPGSFGSGFAEMTDEPIYSIETR